MKVVFFGAAAVVASVCWSSGARALDTGRAQADMHKRIQVEVDRFKTKVGASDVIEAYCRVELDIKVTPYPQNGSIPLGVNYNSITDQKTLDIIIYNREAFETVFLKRCIAGAMKDLQ